MNTNLICRSNTFTWIFRNFRFLHDGRPFIVGIAGGTASGKTSISKEIMTACLEQGISDQSIGWISQDSFYRELETPKAKKLALQGKFDFDHPNSLDHEFMMKTIRDIHNRRETFVPTYDFKTSSRLQQELTRIPKLDVLLLEGILAFYFEDLREMLNLRIFVDTDADIRLSRRILRDVKERGRNLETILAQYSLTVKPAFENYCLPTKKFAHIIIPNDGEKNKVAIDMVVHEIQKALDDPGS